MQPTDLHSMTGFARQSLNVDEGSISWEIRSVNSRYLEMKWRLPEALRDLELDLAKKARNYLTRGKIECSLSWQVQSPEMIKMTLNQALLQNWQQTAQQLGAQLVNASSYSVIDVMQWPDMLQVQTISTAAMRDSVVALFETTIAKLLISRSREGAAIKDLLHTRVVAIQQLVSCLEQQLAGQIEHYQQQLEQRCRNLAVDLDAQRLAQEVALIAQRYDVTEELDRLKVHGDEVLKILQQGHACGRRLDFLMQELNREANTLGAKSTLLSQTQMVVELKVLIEQMREQIQNLE